MSTRARANFRNILEAFENNEFLEVHDTDGRGEVMNMQLVERPEHWERMIVRVSLQDYPLQEIRIVVRLDAFETRVRLEVDAASVSSDAVVIACVEQFLAHLPVPSS